MASRVPPRVSNSVPPEVAALADRIDAVLPQTQCKRCGFAACRPYADAVAAGTSDINRCPPGGADAIEVLAALTGRTTKPLAPECGTHGPRVAAAIDETLCIGCTLCIAACPVDAILGAPKRMHTVLPSLCSGCELCLPPCPVDCITLIPVAEAWTADDADAARTRYGARASRLARGERIARRAHVIAAPAAEPTQAGTVSAERGRRQAVVAAALARARARRATGAKGKS